ncbi:hypothetical protein GCM10009101_32150 [Brevundimonas lenta]
MIAEQEGRVGRGHGVQRLEHDQEGFGAVLVVHGAGFDGVPGHDGFVHSPRRTTLRRTGGGKMLDLVNGRKSFSHMDKLLFP